MKSDDTKKSNEITLEKNSFFSSTPPKNNSPLSHPLRKSLNLRKSMSHRKSSNKHSPPITEIKVTFPLFTLNTQDELEISDELSKNPHLKIKTSHIDSFLKILKELQIKNTENTDLLKLSCKDIPRNTILEGSQKTYGFRYFINGEEKTPTKEFTEQVSNQSIDNVITEKNIEALYRYFKEMKFPEDIIAVLARNLCQIKLLAIDTDLFYYLKKITYPNDFIGLNASEYLASISFDSQKRELIISKNNKVQDNNDGEVSLEAELGFSSEIKIIFPENTDTKPRVTEVNATFILKELAPCYTLIPHIFHYHMGKLEETLKQELSNTEQYKKTTNELSTLRKFFSDKEKEQFEEIKNALINLMPLKLRYLSSHISKNISDRKSMEFLKLNKITPDKKNIQEIEESLSKLSKLPQDQKKALLEWIQKSYKDEKKYDNLLDLEQDCKKALEEIKTALSDFEKTFLSKKSLPPIKTRLSALTTSNVVQKTYSLPTISVKKEESPNSPLNRLSNLLQNFLLSPRQNTPTSPRFPEPIKNLTPPVSFVKKK
jgi:hypothetical protein